MRLIVFVLLLWPLQVAAQGAASLVADTIALTDDDRLIASGNVEVVYLQDRLSAQQIIYDRTTDQLEITGPIVIQTGDGVILTADQASLGPQLRNGMLQGARVVLDQQLQLAASQIDRVDGRYSQLYQTVATSCQICSNTPPLWDIRAERVIHDQEERQLYFDNATLRVRGVPLLWLPRMRLPDPTLDRSNGFLIPSQRNTTLLGFGVKLPYFITIGDHADVTLTPYLSAETRTLEVIFRQAFNNGDLRIDAAASEDSLDGPSRGYIFAEGKFELTDGYRLNVDIEAVSDAAYLSDYDYSSKDRLDSAVSLLQVQDASLIQAGLTYYQTLRDDETNSSLPPYVAELEFEMKFRPRFGGVASVGASVDSAYRYNDTDGVEGRDVTRAGSAINWRNDWIIGPGIVADVETDLRADIYAIDDDSNFASTDVRVVPATAATFRWPLARAGTNGTVHLIEPTAFLATAETYGAETPNEDSTRNELEQANLFDLSRFAGDDRVETGRQAAIGATWTRIGAEGATSTLSFGRVARSQEQDDFTPSSGLDGKVSDWLVAAQVVTSGGFVFDTRTLIDEENGPTLATALIDWNNTWLDLSATYIWQGRDVDEGREDTVSEWTFDAGFDINEAWSGSLEARYDIAVDAPIDAGIGLQWRNECVTIDLSASRRFTSSSTVDASTSYGISGSLSGFSAGRSNAGPAAQCRN